MTRRNSPAADTLPRLPNANPGPAKRPTLETNAMSAPTEFDKKIKALIKAHRKSGSVTLAQLNGVLPDDMSSPEKIEAAIAMIEEAGLDVVEDDKQKNKKGGGRKDEEG